MGCCCKVDGDKREILGDPLEIVSLEGDCCSPAKVDKVLDSAGYNDCSYCWLKGVKIAFLLEEGPPESFSNYYKYLDIDKKAVAAAVKIEVDFVDYRGGKQGSSNMFPAVVALIYIGVWLVHSL